jgi:hypothetical protein
MFCIFALLHESSDTISRANTPFHFPSLAYSSDFARITVRCCSDMVSKVVESGNSALASTLEYTSQFNSSTFGEIQEFHKRASTIDHSRKLVTV